MPVLYRPVALLALLLLAACDGSTAERLTKSADPRLRMLGNSFNAARPVDSIPLEEERADGAAMAATLLGAAPLLRDAEVQRYVNNLGRWIALHSERPNIPWRFGVVASEDSHVFALPGGYILISSGMLKKLRSEAELAATLAHEIVHTQNRHHLRAYRASAGGDVLKDGLNLAAERSSKKSALLAANATKGFVIEGLMMRGLDKNLEFEADAQGAVLAARAGYNPYALAGVLQTLGQFSASDPGMGQLFKTHPQPSQRLERLAEVMADRLEAYADVPEDNSRFLSIQKRLPRGTP